MRMFLVVGIIVCSLASCNEKDSPVNAVTFKDVELTAEDISVPDIKNYSRRKTENTVDHLYHQALEMDANLRDLEDKIQKMWKVEKDSMKDINDYFRYNNHYYSSLEPYLSSISDTSRRLAMREYFSKSEKIYKASISELGDASDRTRALSDVLTDEHIMLKLIVSESLIRSYQAQRPKQKTIEGLNRQYESIIQEIDPYIVLPE